METDGVLAPSTSLTSSLSPSILTPPAQPAQGLFLCPVSHGGGNSVVWAWFQLSRGLKLILWVIIGILGKSLWFY